MATDTKRPNTNKIPIALPKSDAAQTTNAQLISQDVSLQLAVGSRVRITTAQPDQTIIEGIIYVVDPITNLVAINTTSSVPAGAINPSSLTAPSGSYRLISISQISSFNILNLDNTSKPQPSTTSPSQIDTLDTTALSARLQRAITTAQQTQARQGPRGTSTVDQAIFDALTRQYRTRWQGTSMIISDQFVVDKPYDSKTVKLLPGATGDLERMKKILEMEKKKAELKQPILPASGATAGAGVTRVTPAGNQRKGG